METFREKMTRRFASARAAACARSQPRSLGFGPSKGYVEEDEDRVLRDTRSFTRSLRLTGLRASLSSNSIRADGSTAGAGSRSSASAGSGSRSRASSESRSRETSEHAAAPPYPSPASLSRSI